MQWVLYRILEWRESKPVLGRRLNSTLKCNTVRTLRRRLRLAFWIPCTNKGLLRASVIARLTTPARPKLPVRPARAGCSHKTFRGALNGRPFFWVSRRGRLP